jgi:hypothetical protein
MLPSDLPQAEPAPWPGHTKSALASSRNMLAEANSALAEGRIVSATLAATSSRSGRPRSPTNRKVAAERAHRLGRAGLAHQQRDVLGRMARRVADEELDLAHLEAVAVLEERTSALLCRGQS